MFDRLRRAQQDAERDDEERREEERLRRQKIEEEKERRRKEEYQRKLEEMKRRQAEEEKRRHGQCMEILYSIEVQKYITVYKKMIKISNYDFKLFSKVMHTNTKKLYYGLSRGNVAETSRRRRKAKN